MHTVTYVARIVVSIHGDHDRAQFNAAAMVAAAELQEYLRQRDVSNTLIYVTTEITAPTSTEVIHAYANAKAYA